MLLPQKIMWPLVPPKPKEETCTCPWLYGNDWFSLLIRHSKSVPWSKCGLRTLAWFPGSALVLETWRTHLMIDDIAAPPSIWPVVVFMVVINKGSLRLSLICTLRTEP